MLDKPLAVILGAGPGLGEALCHTFDGAGYQVVGVNRTNHSSGFENRVLDLNDANATTEVMQDLIRDFGAPAVVVHNPAQLSIKGFLETSSDEYLACWQAMSQSLFTVMQAVLPSMLAEKKGCLLVSGATASIRGGNKFSAFASAKFALRGLTQSLAREFQSQGIHVVHVLLDGIIDTQRSREMHSLSPDKMLKANEIAEQYLALAQQKQSVWTHELDLRPSSENF